MDESIVKKLSKFGLVKTCKMATPDVVTIVVTTGFTENAVKTFQFIEACQKCFPNHPVVETCITEKDLAILVLKS